MLAAMSRWAPRLAAAAAGAALALVFPRPSLWWWAYVGLAPVLLLIRTAPDRREAVWRSWLAACGFFGSLHYWLTPHLSFFVVGVVLLIGVVWVPTGLTAWTVLRGSLGIARAGGALALVPSVWLLTEYVRSWDRLGGSWGFLGLSQWKVPVVLAAAAVGGVWAVSALLAVTNVAATVALAPRATRGARAGGLVVAGVLVTATVTYGLLRPAPHVEGELRIGGVQPGVVHGPAARLAANERITRELVRQHPDIDVVVWGQSSVGFDLERAPAVRGRLLALAAEIDRQVVVNVDARRPNGRISKSAVVVEPGGLGATYRKRRLVPFGEYIPLRSVLGWVARLSDAADEDRAPGAGLTTFPLAGVRTGPLISYESTFPDLRRALAQREVELTLVQAAATTFQGTWALPQQASFEAVRAVESGRPAVLVAVSGTSSAFDARGRRLAWIPQTYTGGWIVDVPLAQEETPFVRWGPWLPLVALAVVTTAAAAGTIALLAPGTGRFRPRFWRQEGRDVVTRRGRRRALATGHRERGHARR